MDSLSGDSKASWTAFITENGMGHSCNMIHSTAASHPITTEVPSPRRSTAKEMLRMGTGHQLLDVTALPFGTHVTEESIHLLFHFFHLFSKLLKNN